MDRRRDGADREVAEEAVIVIGVVVGLVIHIVIDAETDSRKLHVLFEIGRFELPASKVKQLAPNAPPPITTTVSCRATPSSSPRRCRRPCWCRELGCSSGLR